MKDVLDKLVFELFTSAGGRCIPCLHLKGCAPCRAVGCRAPARSNLSSGLSFASANVRSVVSVAWLAMLAARCQGPLPAGQSQRPAHVLGREWFALAFGCARETDSVPSARARTAAGGDAFAARPARCQQRWCSQAAPPRAAESSGACRFAALALWRRVVACGKRCRTKHAT